MAIGCGPHCGSKAVCASKGRLNCPKEQSLPVEPDMRILVEADAQAKALDVKASLCPCQRNLHESQC